jgi:hypothetical protein
MLASQSPAIKRLRPTVPNHFGPKYCHAPRQAALAQSSSSSSLNAPPSPPRPRAARPRIAASSLSVCVQSTIPRRRLPTRSILLRSRVVGKPDAAKVALVAAYRDVVFFSLCLSATGGIFTTVRCGRVKPISPIHIDSPGFSSGLFIGREVDGNAGNPRYRSPALIFSSAAEPGQSSFSPSVLSGASVVLRCACRSSGSSAM